MLGDRVTRVNGHRVRTSNDITYEFLRDRDGLIDMTVVREGETLTLPVQFRMEQLEEGVQAIEIDFKVAAIPATPGQYLTYPVNWSLSIVKPGVGVFSRSADRALRCQPALGAGRGGQRHRAGDQAGLRELPSHGSVHHHQYRYLQPDPLSDS